MGAEHADWLSSRSIVFQPPYIRIIFLKSYRADRKLENTVKQRRFKHLGELHKEWTEAGVSASRVTMLRCLQEKGYHATSETEMSEASFEILDFYTHTHTHTHTHIHTYMHIYIYIYIYIYMYIYRVLA